MAKKKHEFKTTKDVDFSFVEALYKESYETKKVKVVQIIRTKIEDGPWRDITTTDSAAKSVVKLAKQGFAHVRMTIRINDDHHTYMNIPIKELHTDFKYPKPKAG